MLRKLLAFTWLIGVSIQAVVNSTWKNTTTDNLTAPLTFTAGGTFKISIFEDLHFGENAWDSWGHQQDINSVKVLNQVLDSETPGLVVLNGDLITGENTYLENSTEYVDQIVGPIVQRGLTWASTYGNHDHNFNMVFGLESGISNYYLPVYDPSCCASGCAPELLLWFFDSRGGWYYQMLDESGNQVGQPDWVDISVVNWFESTNQELVNRHGKVIPSLVFVHIPTNASLALQEIGINPHHQPGINHDIPLAQQAQGWCEDGSNDTNCSYGGQDGPFMYAIVSTPGLIAVFSGHDHGDTWCYKWDSLLPGMIVEGNGVNLCFGQHSGYGGYGNWERGARQVLVTQEKLKNLEVDTWIRLESGNVVGSVSLNATYGQDNYTATPDTRTYCPTCNYTIVTPILEHPRREAASVKGASGIHLEQQL